MKRFMILLIFFLQLNEINGQYFAPSELIVNATDLRFRELPNIESKIIDVLEDGELLEFIEFVEHEDHDFIEYEQLKHNWLKVKRKLDNKTGYVFGKYVRSSNLGYRYGQKCDRLPNLNWYGIKIENEKPVLSAINPSITKSKFETIITDDPFSYYIFGSRNRYKEGLIDGMAFSNETLTTLHDNEEQDFILENKANINISICHDLEITDNKVINTIERMYITVTNSDNEEILFQELTEQFHHTQNLGFYIWFIGDINDDKIPELFISPKVNSDGRTLWFTSENDQIFLRSIVYNSTVR